MYITILCSNVVLLLESLTLIISENEYPDCQLR